MSERVRRRALARSVAGALGRALAVAAVGGAATGVAHAQEDVRLPRGGEDASLPGQASIAGPGGAAVSRSLAGLLPRDGRVVSGSASISGDGGRLTITQSSNRAIINWASFDIGAGNSVVFAQPDATSATLNRVTGSTGSTIAGQLSATGSVFLINPNGIVITASGTVQAGGGFVASTLDIADGDFNAGRLVFTGSGASKAVSNAGTIRVGAGGYAALLGGSVSHGGTIDVPLGRVAIGSGEQVALDLSGDGFLRVAVPTQALVGEDRALIELAGQIASAGGRVEVRAATVADAVRNVVNFTGTISADSAVGDGGTIILIGGSDPQNMAGTARYSGTLSARATGTSGNGGFVETSGQDLKLDGVRVDTRAANGRTGTWLIDPVTLTVDAGAASTIGTNLATANVTLQTTSTTASGPGVQDPAGAGDIIINSAINWTSGNTLSLLAFNNITLNAAISGPLGSLVLTAGNNVANTGAITTGTNGTINVGLFNLTNGNWSQNSATLPAFAATDFRFDVTKASFLRVSGGNGAGGTPYLIADVYGVQGVASSNQLAASFRLANTIDASGTARWNGGAGFVPIGTDGAGNTWTGTSFSSFGQTGYSGIFDGQGFTISGLTIARPTVNRVGLFGWSSGDITRLGVIGATVTGNIDVGALIGRQSDNTTTLSYATGTVSGRQNVGVLAGTLAFGSIQQSYAAGSATASGDSVGGLVGNVIGVGATLSQVYATASVSGSLAGGLVGVAAGGTQISQSYASGAVSGSSFLGGLVGVAGPAAISNSYWDSYSTGRSAGVGGGNSSQTNVNAVTSDPAQSAAANYAYKASAYSNLSAGTNLGTTNASGFVFMPGNSTRPFLAFEVPSAATSGTGTGGAIRIQTPNQLQLIGYDGTRLSGNYVLARDLDLSATGAVTVGTPGSYAGMWSSAGFVPIGTDGAGNVWNGTAFVDGGTIGLGGGFSGSFSGGGRQISGLTINRGGASYIAPFGYLSGTISSVFISGSITGGVYVGGLIGWLNRGTVSLAGSSARVTGVASAGGLIGWHSLATVSLSYATGAVTATASFAGGLVGSQNGGTIRQSYAQGAVASPFGAGGLVGQSDGTIRQSYATGAVSGTGGAADSLGGLAGQSNGVIDQSYATGAVGAGTRTGGLIGLGAGTLSNSYWDSYSTGQSVAIGDNTATVTNVSAVTSDPTQAAAANYAYRASAYANLPAASGIGTTGATGFVFMPGNSTRPFLSFEVPSAATSGTDSIGRILIQTANQLQLIGYDATRLSGSYALARSLDLSATGAVVSGTPGSYAGMWSSAGWIPIGSDGAGSFWNGTGFVALNTITAAPYGFSGSLTGQGFGVTNLTISRSTVNNVGLVGLLSGSISYLSLGGTVTGRNGVGGLAGLSLGATISLVTSSVNVTGNNNVGGLVGNLNTGSTVTRSTASGTASGAGNVGGLIGSASGATISRSSASGAVTGTTFYAGGLIGYLDTTTLTDSFASGTVGGATSAGGLIGRASGGSVTNTYAIGAVTATAFASGLIGTRVNGGTVTASYWNTETTGQASSLGGGTGLTSAQFQSQTNFVGWDFTNIWTPPGTRPTLRP